VILVRRSPRIDVRAIRIAGLAAACCISCTSAEDPGDRPVARAYQQVLHWSDLRQVIPLDAAPEDSVALAKRFIDGWIRQQVVMHVAEQNRSEDAPDMDALLEDYRRSLVIFNYEQALVEQKLDTSVSAAEIQAYYESDQANFELKEDIVRARWFKVNEPEIRVLRKMEERFLSGDQTKMREVEIWLAQRGVSIVDRTANWTSGSELRAELALPEGLDLRTLTTGRQVTKEVSAAWFLEVVEHRNGTSPAPIEMVEQDIRSVLLNKRKLQLIATMRDEVYRQAVENKDVEQYVP
jgi:hypothetical protein